MLKKFLLSLVVAGVCSTSAMAQDVFISFGTGADARSSFDTVASGTSGSAFIYSDAPIEFQAFDLDLNLSSEGIVNITGANIFNSHFSAPPFVPFANRFTDPTTDRLLDADDSTSLNPAFANLEVSPADASSIRLVAVGGIASGTFGVQQALQSVDPQFDGAANANLLAEVFFDIVGNGGDTVDFNLTIGENEFFNGGNVTFVPSIDSGTLTVATTAVPEPSSAILLALGFAGFAARRRR